MNKVFVEIGGKADGESLRVHSMNYSNTTVMSCQDLKLMLKYYQFKKALIRRVGTGDPPPLKLREESAAQEYAPETKP